MIQFDIPKEETEASFFSTLCKTGLDKLIVDGRVNQSKIDIYLLT